MRSSLNSIATNYNFSSPTSKKKAYAALAIIIFLTVTVAGAFFLSNPQTNKQPQTTVSPSISPTTQNSSSSTPTPMATTSTPSPTPPPTPSPNPAIVVITKEVLDLIISANSSIANDPWDYEEITFVRGKVLVWDLAEDKESDIELYLPSEILASSPDEKITIFAVINPMDPSYTSQVYVAAIYWPEKILAGFRAIDIDDSRENANVRIPAEWINGLPISEALPAFTIIDEVQDIILAANASYHSSLSDQSPTISGKVLVWDFDENKELSYVESILPGELVANSSKGKITVFAVVEKTYDVVGHYTPNGGAATQIYWDVLVLHYPENEIAGRHTVKGLYPPSRITGYSASGDINRPMAEWIISLLTSDSSTPAPSPTPTPIPSSTITPTPNL